MKIDFKQIFVLSLCFAFSQNITGQLSLGIKGHISTVGAPLVEKQDLFSKKLRAPFNPGFSIYAEYRINKKFAIQPELVIRKNRSHYQLRSNVPTVHTSIINYVRFPVLLKISQQQQWVNISFLVGPNLGYAFDMKSGETIGRFTFNNLKYNTLNFSEFNIRQFEMALTLGFSIEKTIAKKLRTSLDLRYDFGINDIMNELSSTFYNRGLALEMGILIPVIFPPAE